MLGQRPRSGANLDDRIRIGDFQLRNDPPSHVGIGQKILPELLAGQNPGLIQRIAYFLSGHGRMLRGGRPLGERGDWLSDR
jgi:hypothetical protein